MKPSHVNRAVSPAGHAGRKYPAPPQAASMRRVKREDGHLRRWPLLFVSPFADHVCSSEGQHKDIRQCTTHIGTRAEHEEPSRHWLAPRSRRGRDLRYGGSKEGCRLSTVAPG